MSASGVEIWRGGVTPWQCDEMGHMNMGFYLAIATEGMAGLAAALGMPHAFSTGAGSTLLVREHHVRFLKEARPGDGLTMTGGVLSIGETDAVLLQVLTHASGQPAAAITARVSHVTPQGEGFRCGDRAGRDPEGSGPEGSGPEGSGPEGSDPEGSGPEGSGPEGSGPKGSDPEGSGPEGSWCRKSAAGAACNQCETGSRARGPCGQAEGRVGPAKGCAKGGRRVRSRRGERCRRDNRPRG